MTGSLPMILFMLLLWWIAAGWLWVAWRLVCTKRLTPELGAWSPEDFPPFPGRGDGILPPVTALVPARNEAAAISACIRSLLAQQGVDIRVIAVDDRSGDGTGDILNRLAAGEPRLTVLRVERLPPGWLGKNHANHLAAAKAAERAPAPSSEEVLLFTDGDVSFAPGALAASLDLMRVHGLGHLAVSPGLVATGYWERAFQASFAWIFAVRFRLWQLQVPGSRAYVGIGACNLVRRADYDRIGGHVPLAMEVVDDVKLGLLLRRGGVPQGLASGRGHLSVRWQEGFVASLRGLQKNLFAGAGWRWSALLGGAASLLLGIGAPWLALGWSLFNITGLPMQGVSVTLPALLGCLLPMILVGATARSLFANTASSGDSSLTDGSWGLEACAAPVVLLAFIGALLVSAARATLRGGILWRDTFHSLVELRAGCIHESAHPPDKAPGWPVGYPQKG